MDSFTPTEKRAAHALLASYPFAGLETVAEFAARASMSAPSILRFVAKLGFNNYSDFQRELRSELEAQLESPVAKSPTHESAATKRHGDELLYYMVDVMKTNIQLTCDSTVPGELRAVIKLLSEEKHIHVSGGQFTGVYAAYLMAHLRMLRRGVSLLESHDWRDRVLDMGRRDVLVIFDIRRYDKDAFKLATSARSKGATVVLITDAWLSPISQQSTYILPAHTKTGQNWDSTVGILLLCETLVSGVTHQLWPAAKERLIELEQYREHQQ